MSQFPALQARHVIKFLKKQGFVLIRQKGSHQFYRHSDGRSTIVPVHQGEDIGRGLLLEILKDINISSTEFLRLRK